MAWDINRVVLVGRLSSDVELRYTPNGTAVSKFSIAVGGMPSKDGKDPVNFFYVQVWGKSAETAHQYLNKGDQIAIDGRLDQRSWTVQDGTRRNAVEVVADRLEFLNTKSKQNAVSNNDTELNKNDPFDEDVPF